MSWIQVLSDTYDRIDTLKPWKSDDSIEPLLPIGHLFVKAQLTVSIDEAGNFLGAEVESESSMTPNPCTEDSASRSGKKAAVSPHGLADKLYYFVGELRQYGIDNEQSYNALMNLHKEWISGNAPECIVTLHKYLKRQTLIKDLKSAGLLVGSSGGDINWNKERLVTVPTTKPFETVVRWMIRENGEIEERIWKREDVAKSWVNYYLLNKKEVGVCQVTGEIQPIAVNHPKNLNPLTANAKIISANDASGYTYRGRFTSSEQANQIGYRTSQRVHNALRYLVMNQGQRRGTSALVFWTKASVDVVSPVADTKDYFNCWDISDEDDLGNDIALLLKRRLEGFNVKSLVQEEIDKIYIMTIEAVTTGRMTITYFRELDESDYLNRLMKWHNECRWKLNYYIQKDDGKYESVIYMGAPSVYDIINTVYGKPKDSEGKSVKVSDSLFLSTRDRLLHCILEGAILPTDLVNGVVHQLSNRHRYHDEQEFNRALAIGCAMINKAHIDKTKEAFKLALEENRRSRDYLYGRLLAIAQNIESWSIKDSGNGYRMTNADRLMQRFSQRPFSTWKTIELSIKPYQERLGEKGNGRMKLLDEVMGLFEADTFMDDRPLSGEFLIGYHCQRQAIFNNIKDKEEANL
jgi:CRISPR-associated protein Csd1